MRLPVQGRPDRGLGGGEIEPAVEVLEGRVPPRLEAHHWGRVRLQERQSRRQAHQGSDMGHRRTRKVSAAIPIPAAALLPSSSLPFLRDFSVESYDQTVSGSNTRQLSTVFESLILERT